MSENNLHHRLIPDKSGTMMPYLSSVLEQVITEQSKGKALIFEWKDEILNGNKCWCPLFIVKNGKQELIRVAWDETNYTWRFGFFNSEIEVTRDKPPTAIAEVKTLAEIMFVSALKRKMK